MGAALASRAGNSVFSQAELTKLKVIDLLPAARDEAALEYHDGPMASASGSIAGRCGAILRRNRVESVESGDFLDEVLFDGEVEAVGRRRRPGNRRRSV